MRTSIQAIAEVEIERPRPEVWSVLSDAERLPEWFAEFEEARQESAGPSGLGTVIRYTLRTGHRSGTFEIVEWDPPRRLAWDGPPLHWAGGATRPRGSHELVEAGADRTLLVSRYDPELSGTQVLLRPYMKRWLRRERHASARALKALVEATAGS